MKSLTQYINEAKESTSIDYKEIKNKLSRLGFAPRGRNDEEWDFESIEIKSGDWYSVRVFLDENGTPFEYTLSVCDDEEDKFETFDDLIDSIKATKKSRKVKESKDEDVEDVIFRKEKDGEIIAFFPNQKYGKNIGCYAHIGQHSEADIEYYRETKPASKEEYQDLYDELTNVVGYKLNVIKRMR